MKLILEKWNKLLNEEEDSIHVDAIQQLGFNNIEYISKGLYGSVYRGTWDSYDGVEHAIKVMPAGNGKEEARIYKTICLSTCSC